VDSYPDRLRLVRGTGYSPNLLEVEFCELRDDGVLRSSLRTRTLQFSLTYAGQRQDRRGPDSYLRSYPALGIYQHR
jgi:hypothetical protein